MADTHSARSFRVGLVQMCSGRDVERNVSDASDLIRRAKREGADYIPPPALTTIMEVARARLPSAARPEAGNPALLHFQTLARELGVFLHIGSMAGLLPGGRRAARLLLLSPS